MGIARTLSDYLAAQGVSFELVRHPYASSATRTAEAAHVPGDRLAKAVLVEDAGHYMLAILPASRRLHLGQLHHLIGEHVGLATEQEVAERFPDCALGAIPALAAPYGLEPILDEHAPTEGDVYLEGGDHETLVKLPALAWRDLLGAARHGLFSRHL
ncbi:YbaK/prolyl-tRNA synthetase associated region [Thioalkalivibrio sp. K90mix]|jgi:Ala-tRNA(Pro) deacylase|uniref:aminoacyl-tRNA deacylase n=1 Tax=unclassified Thioalkalivibrio TaxID=2621013 RepID=UPI000195AB83|nr:MULTISPECIES: YbaK/EbsC family protein [unclassified Thioalkalivibrio]ADC71861.1 YbaK/prolyl-tRNA synthetase associated region [Thioalkalivibrio sp. K90mix]